MRGGQGVGRGRWRWLLAPFTPDGLAFVALVGFSILSAYATAQGFADLRAANTDGARLGLSDLVLTYAVSAFVIAAMIVALHQALGPGVRWWVRLISAVVYLLFAVWSVGFGYGFFWKELAGQEFTRAQFETMVTDASRSLSEAGLALETAEQAATGAARLSRERADIESRQGGTCLNRPGSVPGDGPLTRGRFAFADRADALAEDMREVWLAPLAERRAGLDRQIQALQGRAGTGAAAVDSELLARLARANELPMAQRRALYLGVYGDIRGFTDSLNAMRALHAPAFAERLSGLASEVGEGAAAATDPAACRDVVLEDRLAAASAQVTRIAPLAPPEFTFVEGPRATRAAFFGLMDVMLAPLGRKAQGTFPFGAREALALFASLAVDLGIVFLTLVRLAPRRPPPPDPGVAAPQPPVLSTILPP